MYNINIQLRACAWIKMPMSPHFAFGLQSPCSNHNRYGRFVLFFTPGSFEEPRLQRSHSDAEYVYI